MAVAERGFHWAMVPSQAGIVDVNLQVWGDQWDHLLAKETKAKPESTIERES